MSFGPCWLESYLSKEKESQLFNSYLWGEGTPEISRLDYYARQRMFEKGIKPRPTDPHTMASLERAKVEKSYDDAKRNISANCFGGWSTPSSHEDGHRQLKQLEDQYTRYRTMLEPILQKYKEEVYPQALKDYDEEQRYLQEERQERIYQQRVARAVYNKNESWEDRALYEKEKLRRQMMDPEWEQLQLELERKKIQIRKQAEEEANFQEKVKQHLENMTEERKKYLKMMAMNADE